MRREHVRIATSVFFATSGLGVALGLRPISTERILAAYVLVLAGIALAAERLGRTPIRISVGTRTGDTPADERRRMLKRPPDILVTTPESLYLLLTSAGRETLRDVEHVIVDEVHAVAGTKRQLSNERRDRRALTSAKRTPRVLAPSTRFGQMSESTNSPTCGRQ